MNRGSLKLKITLLVGSFTALMLLSVAATFYVVKSQSSDAAVIDIAARQRTLVFKITKEAFDLVAALESESSTEEIRKKLLRSLDLFDKSLKALKDGGLAWGSDRQETVLPGTSGKANEHLQKVAGLWHPFRNAVQIISTPDADTTSNEFFKAGDDLNKLNHPLLKESGEALILLRHASEKKTTILKTILTISVILTILLSVVSWFLNERTLVNPIVMTARMMDRMSEKDFTSLMTVNSGGEIGRMSSAVNNLITIMSDLFDRLISLAGHLSAGSEEMSVSADQIARGSEAQSARASQVATASHEMKATIEDIARSASGAAEASRKANEVATGSGDIVDQTIESIKSIASTSRETSDFITALGERSKDVGNVVQVIEEIANQTNLLALNAAIEAARAGEQGRGFAVVADEVRKLAEKTTEATKEIGATINQIQDDTNRALSSMNNEMSAVENGVRLTESSGSALKAIVGEVREVSTMIEHIAIAVDEQSSAADQISNDIEAVAELTKESSAGAHQISRASQEIAEFASSLQSTIAMFKVQDRAGDPDEIDAREVLEDKVISGS